MSRGWSTSSCQFHIHRSKAIFDWIFHVPSEKDSQGNKSLGSSHAYELYYLSINDVGLSKEALEARRSHEARGETNVRTKLAMEYTSLKGVWRFLTTHHDFYTASKISKRGIRSNGERGENNLLKLSYGKSNGPNSVGVASPKATVLQYKGGKIILTLDVFLLLVLAVVFSAIFLSVRNKYDFCRSKGSNKHED